MTPEQLSKPPVDCFYGVEDGTMGPVQPGAQVSTISQQSKNWFSGNKVYSHGQRFSQFIGKTAPGTWKGSVRGFTMLPQT